MPTIKSYTTALVDLARALDESENRHESASVLMSRLGDLLYRADELRKHLAVHMSD